MQIAPPKPLKVGNEYRDAIQARFGGNWSTPDLIAGQAHVNDVGWATVQTGGGTFFHKPLLNGECPWERTKAMYKAVDAPNSILVRGDTLVGYQTNPDDVIEGFIEAQARAGVDVFTIFDGLNDTRNQIGVIQAVNKMKPQIKADTGRDLKAEGVICVGDSPEYTMERYMQTARELHKAGADNFYIKDPCGVVHPDVVFELVSRLKEEFPAMDVTMHSHNCYGLAYAQYIAAIEAGADQVNALHPLLADSTAQPCVLSLIDMMKNHPNPEVRARVPDINVDALKADNEPVAERCLKYRDYEMPFDPARLAAMYGAKAPGGASSTLYGVVGKTLEQAGFKKEDWPQTERMIYEHEAKISPLLGNVLKVTPQAMTMTTVAAMSLANMPKDWDEEQNGPFVFLTPDLIKLIVGLRGKVHGAIDPDIQAKALKEAVSMRLLETEDIFEGRPADTLKPMMGIAKQKLIDAGVKDPSLEDIVTVAMWSDAKNTGLNHVLARVNGTLEAVEKGNMPGWTKEPEVRWVKKDGDFASTYAADHFRAIGGFEPFERFIQHAFQRERLLLPDADGERYMKGECLAPPASGTEDLGHVNARDVIRMEPEHFKKTYDRWAENHQLAIDEFMSGVRPKLEAAGYEGIHLWGAIHSIESMIYDALSVKGVPSQRIPKVSDYSSKIHAARPERGPRRHQRVIGGITDAIRSLGPNVTQST